MSTQILDALRRGDSNAAHALAQDSLAAEPNNAELHYLLGVAQWGRGETAAARQSMDTAISLAPERADYQTTRASLALNDRDLSLAEEGMRGALALDPNQLDAYLALIHLALARGDGDEAQRQLKLALRVDEEHPKVLMAQGHLAQFNGNADQAIQFFTQASTRDPANALALLSLGVVYQEKQLVAFAEQAFLRAQALDAGNVGIAQKLAETQLRQQRRGDAIDTLGRLLAQRPDAHTVRSQRAQLLLDDGRIEQALADYLVLLHAMPADPNVLSTTCALLVRSGKADVAIAEAEAALALAPDLDPLWAIRLDIDSGNVAANKAVLDRWAAMRPDNPLVLEAYAFHHETLGQFELAVEFADRALAMSRDLSTAQMVKLRNEVLFQPQAALTRIAELLPQAGTPETQRALLGFRGLVLDGLGDYPAAAETFREMASLPLAAHPLPVPMPAQKIPPTGATGTLVWAPVGARVERVFNALHPSLGNRLLADRMRSNARRDGFGHLRQHPGHALAGSAASWQAGIQALGQNPADVVDWLPQWDAYTAAALDGAKVVALMVDPRDTFLNWMVFGSAQGYGFLSDTLRSAEWLALGLEALADTRDSKPMAVSLVEVDDLATRADAVAEQLKQAFSLPELPAAKTLALPMLARGGFPTQFPAGYWRHYADAFAAEFGRLTPVALRLGYSAE